MKTQEIRCDVCCKLLVTMEENERPWVLNSFRNLKIRFKKYQICEECIEEIKKRVRENREKQNDRTE